MPIHSASIQVSDTAPEQLLPDDKARRWYVVQNRASSAVAIGGASMASAMDGLYLAIEGVDAGTGGTLEVRQGHENDKTPCHAVYALCDGVGVSGPVQVIWATEDSTD